MQSGIPRLTGRLGWGVVLACGLAANGLAGQGNQPEQRKEPQFRVEVLEGEGANRLDTGVGHILRVKVSSKEGQGLAGVRVVFTAPPREQNVPTIVFTGGAQSATTVTDAQGIAVSPAVSPLPPAGELQVAVSATANAETVTVLVPQRNVMPPAAPLESLNGTWELQRGAQERSYGMIEVFVVSVHEAGGLIRGMLDFQASVAVGKGKRPVALRSVAFLMRKTGSRYTAAIKSPADRDRASGSADLNLIIDASGPVAGVIQVSVQGRMQYSGTRLDIEDTLPFQRSR